MILLDYDVWLITRAEWGAREPTSVTTLWVDVDTDHWGGPGFGAPFPHESCPAKVRAWQNYHMDVHGWSDIAYNAVGCPHGYVFEGRGRGRRSAANGTTAGNSGSDATCYLGGEGDEFTEAGKRAMKASSNWLTSPGSVRHGHRDWKPTTCPGDTIYGWVTAGQPLEDTLSAAEVEAIKAHVTAETDRGIAHATAETNRVINEIYRSLPYFAHDYDTVNDDMWVVNPATRQKWLVPQSGETDEEQEFPGKAFLADGVFGQVVLGPDGLYHIDTWPNGYPKAWHRSQAHLDLYETV
jgi:hypothetical protein